MNKKIKIASILAPICVFTALPLLINNKDQIYVSLNNFIRATEEETSYIVAKSDPLYPVTTVRKVTSDKNAINLLFMGDNYSAEDPADDFSDFLYKDVITPWFAMPYPDEKQLSSSSGVQDKYRGTRIPFQTFTNDKFNVYSIQPIGNKTESLVHNNKTFFGLYNTADSQDSLVRYNYWGTIKNKVLLNDVSNNFLEDGAIISNRSTSTVFNGYDWGRTPVWDSTLPAMTKWATATVYTHEMMHSVFKLRDEYGENKTKGVNRIKLPDSYTENDVPWKEFLNFRGVGINLASTRYKEYIPSNRCVMKDSNSATIDFCEVCIHAINKSVAEFTQQELFYIADPQLTISENRVTYDNIKYSSEYIEDLEIFNYNIWKGANKHFDLRTVIDNKTTKARNIKLRVKITGMNGFEEYSEPYHIEPGEIKQLVLVTKHEPIALTSKNNTIIGEVIDADTDEVLATSYDRLNYRYLLDKEYYSDFGKQLYKVTINFIDKNTNKPLANVLPSSLIKRDGEEFTLEKILFNGYRLDMTQSNINSTHQVNGKDLTFNYYYDPLPFKSLKLKLLNENNEQIYEKIVKVYEGQVFNPQSSDFWLYDLESFYGTGNQANYNWIYSVQAPTQSISYDEINNNQTELIYKKIKKNATHLNISNRKIMQDKNIDYSSTFNTDFFSNTFDYKYVLSSKPLEVIYNNIDISTPGKYKITFYSSSDTNDLKDKDLKTIEVEITPNPNQDLIPSALEAELLRLNYLNYLIIPTLENKTGSQEDFDAINQSNILDNITNLNLNKDKFNYEIIDFQKFYSPNLSYQFKIKINDKTSRSSLTTNIFTKNIILKSDEPVTPPAEEIEMENEINRINALSLSLKNPTLSQAEANNINQNNILQNVNGWVETSGFAYEVINFSNLNNQFKFKIKASKGSLFNNSNLFILTYQIKSEQSEQELLQQEINRINNLTLSLANNTFSQQEIDQINISNLINYLSNWSLVTSNSNKYNYEITNFDKANNKFTFNIKVTLINDSSISQISKQFNLNYQITTNINRALEEEKNRIDQLDLSFNKQEFSKDEINGILNDPSSITKYLNNWSGNDNQFNYQFIVNPLSENQLGLTIQINDKNNPSEYQSSKSFVLYYEQSIIPTDNNTSSNNLTTVILASTLAPAGAIAVAAGGTIIYKKKRRRY